MVFSSRHRELIERWESSDSFLPQYHRLSGHLSAVYSSHQGPHKTMLQASHYWMLMRRLNEMAKKSFFVKLRHCWKEIWTVNVPFKRQAPYFYNCVRLLVTSTYRADVRRSLHREHYLPAFVENELPWTTLIRIVILLMNDLELFREGQQHFWGFCFLLFSTQQHKHADHNTDQGPCSFISD